MTSRVWFFTLNNYTSADFAKWQMFPYVYLYYGREIGTLNGVPHLHGIVHLREPQRMSWLKKEFSDRAHFNLPDRNDADSYIKWYRYCRKRDSQPFEDDRRKRRGPKKKAVYSAASVPRNVSEQLRSAGIRQSDIDLYMKFKAIKTS